MVIRIEKLTNYAKIDNTYLEDKNISLKAKGLLTLMLSLPDAWNFNINGLRLLYKESKLAVTNALKELKKITILKLKKVILKMVSFYITILFMKNNIPEKYKLNNHIWIIR